MTERERLLAVYRGETPDRVPFFLDLSHWFYQRNQVPFDLSTALMEPDWPLLDYHRKVCAGFYAPNLISFFDASYPADVNATTTRENMEFGPEITWRIETPVGVIERRRRWEEESYSWSISRWGVSTVDDLRVLAYALSRLQFRPAFHRYEQWKKAVGDLGVLYLPLGYSAIGHLLSYWAGVERTIYLAADSPMEFEEAVSAINHNLLHCVEVLCQSPAEVIFLGDNFSSDIQSPRFFGKWSAPFYRETARRIRAAGKFSAVHVDGRLSGLLSAFGEIGVDCIDAVTPAPMGDLTPEECRDEAGPQLILSGGVPPPAWIEPATDDDFRDAVGQWLALRARSPRLVAAAGDQVPPGALEHRIGIMREMVEQARY
ncbi:MAG: uroporphyrinogen decarboxylase family protein [Bryobacteraceae bacterium]